VLLAPGFLISYLSILAIHRFGGLQCLIASPVRIIRTSLACNTDSLDDDIADEGPIPDPRISPSILVL